ncbi:MAG TPA: hypothetical protein VF989_04625, partial [Polyangiaceae bacterium]
MGRSLLVTFDDGLERELDVARQKLRSGNLHGAVEALRRVLGRAPEHALAHTLLAAALLDQRRIHAGLHEAKLGVQLDVEAPLAHQILGRAYLAQRKFELSDEHLTRA